MIIYCLLSQVVQVFIIINELRTNRPQLYL